LPAAAIVSTPLLASCLYRRRSPQVGEPPPSDMLITLAPASAQALTASMITEDGAEPLASKTLAM
jgi:hypothetical protein